MKRNIARIVFLALLALAQTGCNASFGRFFHTDNPSDEYAKRANRRIFIEGTASGSENIRELAKRNNDLVSDSDFAAMLEADSKMTTLQNDSTRPEMMREFRNIISSYDPGLTAAEKNAAQLLDSANSRIAARQNDRAPQKTGGKPVQKISTRTGNVFVGTVTEETAEGIVLTTGFGQVRILKSDIAKRDVIK